MSPLDFYRHLLASGVAEDTAYDVASKFETDSLAEAKAREADLLNRLSVDLKAEARKAKDRARKAEAKAEAKAGIPRNSTESTESAEIQEQPLSLPLSPQTPQTPTHTRASDNTREQAREAEAFERFWLVYPRKVSKADARKAYGKAWRKLPAFDEEAVIIGGLERAMSAWSDAQFIPHAATWLNGERWNDEPSTVIPIRAHDRPHNDKLSRKQANLSRAFAASERAAGFRGEP